MAYCTECGQILPENAKFCSSCGTPVGQQVEQESFVETTERKVNYSGEIHKCPNCGEILSSFESKCPSCGYELRGIKAAGAVSEFAMKLELIESMREQTDVQQKAESADQLSSTDKQKISLIRSFAIPNTKEDLFEFMILAASNIDTDAMIKYDLGSAERAVPEAWTTQFVQAYKKAQFVFSNEADFAPFQRIYEEKVVGTDKKKKKKDKMDLALGFGVLGGAAVAILFVIVIFINGIRVEVAERRLERRLDEVYEYIEDGQYEVAKSMASLLVYSGPDNKDGKEAAEKWDNTREQLLELIDEALNKK